MSRWFYPISVVRMLVALDISAARRLFDELPSTKRNPYLHPDYVSLDAAHKGAEPYFFGGSIGDKTYLFSGHFIDSPELAIRDSESPRGYGGLLCSCNEPLALREAYEQYRRWLAKQSCLVEFVRFHPLLANHHGFDGDVFVNRQTCSVVLTSYHMKQLGSRALRYVKKAKKADCFTQITLTPDTLQLAAFTALYNQRMDELDGMKQYRYRPEYFQQLFELPIVTALVMVWHQQRLIAAAILMGAGEYLEYHLSCSDDVGRQLGATNLLLHEASQHFSDQYRYLHLGGGLSNDQQDPLFQFKHSVGKTLTPFLIGGFIIDSERYEKLKQSIANPPRRIIFYRPS
ncbi:GNAT family N-acetyltransferase [Maribrevibacterium harenarium]|uniref:GNAT family N-acetyltransferase n=2 Tax=Maribrevibacterium harenarium TaxID=2589817 RepID=A0A501X334_9GAMM|nr:GNAT family N-acetyltransferase [Maribrevibacterium harenarium]